MSIIYISFTYKMSRSNKKTSTKQNILELKPPTS